MEGEPFRIIYSGGCGQIMEKKSRFLATVEAVHTEEEALAFITGLRKRYWDATHNCYAYVLGEHQECARCFDDGEPSLTAGRPMLDVLINEHIHDAVVVVTRYFGGTLLGTGGLVRAYGRAAAEGLAQCRIVERQSCTRLRVVCDYAAYGKLTYAAAARSIYLMESTYTQEVETVWIMQERLKDEFIKKIQEITGGQARITDGGVCYAAFDDSGVLLL